MTKDLIQAYAARVTQASRSELIVITYEIILSDIDFACKAYNNNELEEFQKDLQHASRFLQELMSSLDYSYRISYDLMSLYIYANKLLVSAMYEKKVDSLKTAVSILTKLLEGFRAVSKEDTSGPMMQNTQQLYAGLTYGKGFLNETYIDPNQQNRGFKA